MSANPPSGTIVYGGTWNTDLQINTSVVKLGASSVEIKSGASTGAQLSTVGLFPVDPVKPLSFYSWVRASSVGVNDQTAIGIAWYDAAEAFISTSWLHNAVLPSADTWHYLGGVATPVASAAKARAMVMRAGSGTAYSTYINSLDVRAIPMSCLARMNTTETGLGNGAMVHPDTEVYDYGGLWSTTNKRIEFPWDGVYTISWCMQSSAYAADQYLMTYIQDSGGNVITQGTKIYSRAAAQAMISVGTYTGFFTRADNCSLYVAQNTGGNVNAAGHATQRLTWISCTAIPA